jgi:hypothetical protein
LDRRFVGSTVALILGLLFLITAASRGQDAVPQILSGVGVIVGALAFRSLKRRRLGLCDDSIGRRVAEGAALVSIVALVLLQSNVLARNREPVPNHLIPTSEQLLAYVNPRSEAAPMPV